MPELPKGFYFTQVRFQDFLDCKRRFQLRYLLEQPWPAQVVEPVDAYELQLEHGRRFHRLIQQYLLKIPAEALAELAAEPPLSRWWHAFRKHGLEGIPTNRQPEVTRSTSLAGYRLVGKFDLLAFTDTGDLMIVDWKTSRVVPGLNDLQLRMQSRLYPFIIAREGLDTLGFEDLSPKQISMRYWYAQDPHKPREFVYSREQFNLDEQFLIELIHEIEAIESKTFELTDDLRKCRYCLYRSLCDRGIQAGSINDLPGDEEIGDWPASLEQDLYMEFEI